MLCYCHIKARGGQAGLQDGGGLQDNPVDLVLRDASVALRWQLRKQRYNVTSRPRCGEDRRCRLSRGTPQRPGSTTAKQKRTR